MEEIWDFPRSPLSVPVAALDPERENGVLTLCACFLHARKDGGPALHTLIRRFLSPEPPDKTGLPAWMQSFSGKSLTQRQLDLCRRQADQWRHRGIRVAKAALPDTGGEICCPSVLFFKGDLCRDVPWLSVFNSRKPRAVSPRSEWLEALRYFLKNIGPNNFIAAASEGTLTYDMMAAHALRSNLPLALVLPFSIFEKDPELAMGLNRPGCSILSCLPATGACAKSRRLFCRDRILAGLSDIHLVLELRSGGNLQSVLSKRRGKTPVVQFIFDPERRKASNAGNYQLLEAFSGSTRKFSPPPSAKRLPDTAKNAVRSRSSGSARIRWQDYLFHYTRSCPGPWPGQTYTEYLLGLLDDQPLSGHSALETLIRILSEKLIRAGSGLVRGRERVISLSSHPPPSFRSLRKWNRSLGRWTVEPYGIAISRKGLCTMGAKPAIYGADEIYGLLPGPEKYRFQLSPRGGPSWRDEREWRLRGDLDLGQIGAESGFAFVPGGRDREEIIKACGAGFPVIVFEEEW